MAAKLLIVGLATDGPSNVVVKPKNESDLRFLFGGGYIERIFASQTSTGAALGYQPWILPLNTVDNRKSYLYAPYMDSVVNNVIYFGNMGGTGMHQLDFTYTPYLGKSDLIYAARKYFQEINELPYVVRLGGTKSTLSVGDWEFEAIYPGSKYNKISVTFSANNVIISGLEPNYQTTEHMSTNPDEIGTLIERDYEAGMSPLVCAKVGSAMMTGTYYLSGGLDGSFSKDDLEDFLTNATLPLEVTHILLLSPLTSDMVNAISDYLGARAVQPRMFFTPAPDYAGPVDTWLANQFSAIPFRHNMISSFIGEITSTLDERETTRYAAEGAAFAFVKQEGFNLTNIPVNATTFSPALTEDELVAVKANGWVPLMRYIKNDISVYEGTTTHNENSFLYSSKVAEIMAVAHDVCYQYLGTILPDGERTEIAQILSNKIAQISFIQLQLVRVVVKGDSMFVYVEANLPTEILKISFTIKNR